MRYNIQPYCGSQGVSTNVNFSIKGKGSLEDPYVMSFYEAYHVSITLKMNEHLYLKSFKSGHLKLSANNNVKFGNNVNINGLELDRCNSLTFQDLILTSLKARNCNNILLKNIKITNLLGRMHLSSCIKFQVLNSHLKRLKVIGGEDNVIKDTVIEKIKKKSTQAGLKGIKFDKVIIINEKSRNRVEELS